MIAASWTDPPGRTLIGRSRELQRLADASARAAGGEARTVLVAGEAGIGKTRLVDDVRGARHAGGGRVLTGGCLALASGGLPYAPFVEALRALVRDTDPGRLPALLGPNRDELARLMPEVRARPTGTAPIESATPGSRRRRTNGSPRFGSSSSCSASSSAWHGSPPSSS